METPPDLITWLVFAGASVILTCLGVMMYWAERSMRMCARLVETIRTMSLAASSPLTAARLEQQRLRQQAAPATSNASLLAEIANHQGAVARGRHAQNRAANPPGPNKPVTMRYVSPDSDLLPDPDTKPDKPTEATTTPVGAPPQ